ncbi:hypothetical protein FNF29_00597 [Cafeteria roenbergensis]|uniref:Uncharacterized protein n=1 Tax=Cafeteria roenbergensis TaxID=33653 RepID=A0A5A8CW29_CAFRO|nr:hypothetical protein FNF29_00597 [Cafeteria roenbergensis]|eukprot:KAA0157245.1 hypothetical protein FNF29_00597 [Cafeteria roenbergensis]
MSSVNDIRVDFSGPQYFTLTAIIVSSVLLVFFWYQRKYHNAAAWTKVYVSAVMPVNYLLSLLLSEVSAVVLQDGTRVAILRYWGWLATCPVLLLDIFSAMPLRKSGQAPVQALAAIILDQLMVICGVSAIIYGGAAKIALFTMGCLCGVCVYYLILSAFFKAYAQYPSEAKPWLAATAILFCGGWLLFPIAWVLGTEGFGIISPDVAPGFSEAYHAVADLIAKCSYSFVGWYTRQVVLARILDRRRAAKESSADGATPRAGGAAGSGLGDVSVPGMAIKGLESAPTSARDAIMRIARALRAFGPGAAIVKHAVAGACDAAAAGVAAAAPAIAKSLLEAAKRASRRRVVRVLLVDPDPLVHTAVCARLRSLAAADVSTGIGANSAVAAASLLRPIDAAVGPTPADPDRSRAGPAAPSSAPRTPALEAMAQAAGLPGIEVVVESVFRLDDVPLVFARGDEHFDCVIATAATLRDLSALDPAEAHKRSLRLFGSASLRDHLTALTLARGRAAASLAAAAGPRTGRSSSARRATQDASHPDFQGALGSGASGARLLREEARRLRTEEPLGLAIKTREVFVSSPPPSLQPAADAPAGAAEQAAPKPAVVGRSSTPDRTAAERRMSLTEAASGAVAAADVRRMMLTKAAGVSPPRPGLTGAAAALQHSAAAGPAPASARSTSARHQRLTELSSAAGPSGAVRGDLTSGAPIVRETHVHPTQRLFGLVPVVAVASDEETVASSGGADPAQALRRELGADLVVSGLDDAAQWRDVLGQVAPRAALAGSLSASGMAYLYRDRSAAERRLPGLRGPADEQQGTAAALPQLAIVLGQEAADDLTLVPTDAVEWRRHARSHSRNRSRRTADGDDSGHLSTNSHGRLIQRRDSAVMAMKGAFFGDSAQPDDADELPPPPSYPGSPAVHTGQDDAAGSVQSVSASRTTSADRKSVPSRTHGSAIVRDRGLGRYNRARRA